MPALPRPAPLCAGEAIAVLAPSGPFSQQRFERGVAMLGERYEVRVGRSALRRQGYLAGSDAERAADLLEALRDPSVRAIVAARGGFGATRLLPALPLEVLRANPKWLVGFSDVTALHTRWAQAGWASVHGPMACSLPEAPPEVQRSLFAILQGADPPPLQGAGWGGGRATGRLMGGNLALLAALSGTPYAPELRGAVVLLEDVGERPYRLDRMLTTLVQAGSFESVAGFALGQFTGCDPGEDGTDWATAVRRNLSPLGVPIVADLRVGHIRDNHPLVLGTQVEVDGDAGQLRPAAMVG